MEYVNFRHWLPPSLSLEWHNINAVCVVSNDPLAFGVELFHPPKSLGGFWGEG